MSDDPLLQELTRVVREDREAEQARLDSRWDALAAGTLSPEEEEELLRTAHDPSLAATAYEAFRPLGEDFRTRAVEAARFQLGARAAPAMARPRRLAARRWLGAAVLSAAACLLLLLWPSDRLPLPVYTLTLDGDVHALRSPGPEPDTGRRLFVPGNRLRLVLTPGLSVKTRISVRAFVLDAGGMRPLDAPPAEISADGAVRIEGEVGADVRLPAGDAWLVVVVGHGGALPGDGDLRSRLSESDSLRSKHWAAWKVPLRLGLEPGR